MKSQIATILFANGELTPLDILANLVSHDAPKK